MADRLTQLQDCLDQLATQMYASLHYISTSASPSAIPGQPYQPGQPAATNGNASAPDVPPRPDESRDDKPSANAFAASLQELAHDLVVKEQQIEALAQSLPGLERGREEQERRMRELEGELGRVEGEWVEAQRMREGLVRRVEGVIERVYRV